MLYQAKKLMPSLGFAACLQELLSDRRARQLLNYFRLRNLNKTKNEDVPKQTETSSFFFVIFYSRENRSLILNYPDYLFGTISNTSTAPSSWHFTALASTFTLAILPSTGVLATSLPFLLYCLSTTLPALGRLTSMV